MATPAWRIAIGGQDVTREVADQVLSVRYTDHAHGQSDDVEVVLDDAEELWRSSWYPEQGTSIELWIGYLGADLLPCGRFEVDEVLAAGPPSTVTIRALAAGISPSLRTKRSAAYEGQTLQQIAEKVAKRHQLTVTGLAEQVRVERVTQSREDDLTFLTRLAEDYGYFFTVRGEQLVFYEIGALEAAGPVFTKRPGDLTSYQLEHRTQGVYRAAEVRYHDAKKNAVVTHAVDADGVTTGDVLKLYARVESQKLAEQHARAALARRNRRAIEGNLTLEGDPSLVAGVTGLLLGFSRFSGRYLVERSEHRLTRESGYETTVRTRAVEG